MLRHALASLAALACLAAGLLSAPAAQATTNPGAAALDWAEAHATGHPFMWGGTGPYGYDCSGLVMEAFAHAGIDLPRTTNEMVDSPHLTRTYHPQRGDLAFFGADSHVEIVAERPDTTFGAHDTGSLVGWTGYGGTWVPTAFYSVH
jgi:cell wall-associated NlpC family hydrolase